MRRKERKRERDLFEVDVRLLIVVEGESEEVGKEVTAVKDWNVRIAVRTRVYNIFEDINRSMTESCGFQYCSKDSG